MMLSASSSSATVRVEKATSDLLINPDWTMNIDICDYVNTHPGQARDILKAVKKRLQHKSPRVQFLALTLLEAMANNCGDYIHFQIVERSILEEMVKIVKKKTDMHVRDKTLSLLDTWQEAFGGQGGKYPQYYYAYDELRRSGVAFPRRSSAVAPIFTPPVAHPVMARVHEGYVMPSNSSRRLDEAMAAEKETLSGSTLESMQNMTELLSDMLQAMSPGDKEDEVVIDLVDRCRASRMKLGQMLTTAEDEKLLAQGLELHDVMQNLLLKHDNIVSGSVLPSQAIDIASASTVSSQPTILSPPASENCSPPHEQKKDISPKPSVSPQSSAATATYPRGFIDEEEEEDDDFAQLARRHSRPSPPQVAFTGNGASASSIETPRQIHTSAPEAPITATSNALALTDLPRPVKTSTDRDIIDLLSLTLTTTSDSSQTPSTPPPAYQNMDNSVSPNGHANPYSCHLNFNNPEQAAFSGYITPWAQPQMQSQTQPQQQAHDQPQYHQNSYGYPPPPWVSSSSSFDNQHPPPMSTSSFGFAAGAGAVSHTSVEGTVPLPNFNPPIVNNRASLSTGPAGAPSSTGRQPYVPSYRLFEDLNVLPNRDTGQRTGNGTSSQSLSGIYEQSRVGGGS